VDGGSEAAIAGVSIDTRTLVPGDLFVALRDARDGHDFVPQAFTGGAAAALVVQDYARRPGDGTLIRVRDPLAALADLGRAARRRTAAPIVAVTGSAGKTGTKEMLRACLAACATRPERVHASAKSFNNHWGVPLTLARMHADTEYGVFEIGMNHAGEITPLTQMVRPVIAIVTNVLPVHLGHFANEEGIAEAKAEIFLGLEAGGTAILLRDSPRYPLLNRRARAVGARIVTFGTHADADVRLLSIDGDKVRCQLGGILAAREVGFQVGVPGAHIAMNALAVVAALDVLGRLTEASLAPFAGLSAAQGRGARETLRLPGGGTALLIDESYNANPASMAAALRTLGELKDPSVRRRIVVLGDMRELGPRADELHEALLPAVLDARADMVLAAGPHMKRLFDRLPRVLQGHYAFVAADLRESLLAVIEPGDAIMIKGSLGTRMGPLVEALRSHFGPRP
jgi:UDP-N-acetylmuramoyl-tripeptide--D-alanyl-D-alanine ligase